MATPNGCEWDLKELLADWKLENIISHLSAEKINVDILEMMNVSHIRLLLYNFPLGVQIRFEYNLERWRREIGIPLQFHIYDDRNPIIVKGQQDRVIPTNEILKPTSQMQSKITQTDLMILDVNTTNSYKNTEKNDDTLTNSRQTNNSSTSSTSTAATVTTRQFKIKSRVPIPASTNATGNSRPMPHTTKAHGAIPRVDLREILTVVPYGVELTNTYRERKTFTNNERRQLVSGIVNYYLDNKIKFNLQTSYVLERAILKMFPNERLDLYRTSKRGRLYSRYLSAKAAMKFMRAGSDAYDNSDMDYGGAAGDDFSDDSQMLLGRNTTDSMSHLDEEDDTFMEDDEYAVDFIGDEIQKTTVIEEDEEEGEELTPAIKIEPENVTEMPNLRPVVLSTELLFNRRKPEEADRPFENFEVPWHKIPTDVLAMLDKQEKLGKRLNALANLFVDELRNICTHIPMRVFRNVTQQVVTKYPYSFLDKDSEGNIISSATIPLLQRMRNRNNFLNR